MRKTKIVCTLGPATDDIEVLRSMVEAGMDVARLNFSHGTHDEHRQRAEKIKLLRREMGVPLALMIDTKGPDIRVGKFKDNFIELRTGDLFTLCTDPCEGDATRTYVTYPRLCEKLSAGDAVMLDDGLIEMTVERTTSTEAVCRVVNGGVLSNNKSLNVPGVRLDIPYMREKDIEDINFAIDNDFDYVAASFVRSAEDVWQIRRILDSRGAGDIKIIAKIENSEGIENISQIMEVCDSIMIARGDMGVELPFSDLPTVQKQLIKKALHAGKITITATQMLESMIKNPRPTRAEVSDVANAIYDGTSAIMLSGETSVGRYPVEVVRTMASIAEKTEADIDYEKRFAQLGWLGQDEVGVTDAVGYSVCSAAYNAKAAIIILTHRGRTAMTISRYRPGGGFITFTAFEKVYHQLSLSWGCTPFVMDFPEGQGSSSRAAMAVATAVEKGLLKHGDRAIVVYGHPFGEAVNTNTMQILEA